MDLSRYKRAGAGEGRNPWEKAETNDYIWLKQLPVKEDEAQPKIVVETIIDVNNANQVF